MQTMDYPTARYGLVGYPLGHSFSAKYFAEKFAREHISAEYVNFELEDIGNLRSFVLSQPTLRGFNVTIPHKQAVMPFLDALSDEARAIGAVNVVKVCDGKLVGYNTDVIGFTESLRPLLDFPPQGRSALVLGTGGASKAVLHGLRTLGFLPQLVSRTKRSDTFTYEEITPATVGRCRLIVNCTPVGMYPHVEEAPAIPYGQLTSRHILFDLIYNPLETEFLRRGREQGAVTKNGLEMLHLQAEAAWQIWQKND